MGTANWTSFKVLPSGPSLLSLCLDVMSKIVRVGNDSKLEKFIVSCKKYRK